MHDDVNFAKLNNIFRWSSSWWLITKKNCSICCSKTTLVLTEANVLVTSESLVWSGGIIAPHFFDKQDAAITINGDTYRTMITDFFVSALHGINVNDD